VALATAAPSCQSRISSRGRFWLRDLSLPLRRSADGGGEAAVEGGGAGAGAGAGTLAARGAGVAGATSVVVA